MKNKKLFTLFLATLSVSAIGAVAATGCNIEHEHAYTWHSDAEGHWEECDCGDKKNSADHVDLKNNETGADGKDGKCDVCDYEIKQVVTFNVLGHGTAPAAQNVSFGAKATKPADPDADGYNFLGWFKDEDCKTAFDFESDVITDSTVLYAKWVENTTPGESMKYAFELVLGQTNPKPLTSKGYTYYKFTATENGRYQVGLPLGVNNRKCYFTTSFDDGVNYGNGYDGDVKYFDLAEGESVYVKLSCAETLPADAQVSVTVSETANEPLPADSWFDGLYTNGDATEFILDRAQGTIILNSNAYYYNYVGGVYNDILTFDIPGNEDNGTNGTKYAFVRTGDGIYNVTATGDSSLNRKLAYFPKLDTPVAVSKFGGVYAPADDSKLANVTEISVQPDGKGYYLHLDEFNSVNKVTVNNPVFDPEYGLLKFGQFMMSLNADGDTVTGVSLFNGDSDSLVEYKRTGDAVPARLPLQSGTEFVGLKYRIVTDTNTYSEVTQKWDYNFDDPLGPDIEVTDFDKTTNAYTVSVSGASYKLVFEGSGDSLSIKVYNAAGTTLLDTLTKYAAVYHNLPSAAASAVSVDYTDFRKGVYHFKAVSAGWYEFNCSDLNLEIYYNLNGNYPTQLYRGTKLDFTDGAQTVYLAQNAIVGVHSLYTENFPETVSFTVGAGLPPQGTDESNPYALNGEGSVSVTSLAAGTKLYVAFTPSAAGKYFVCVSGAMFAGGATNGYRFHYTVGSTEVGWNSANFQWLGGLTNDDHNYKLNAPDTNPVLIAVDGNDDFPHNVTVTVTTDYISDATPLQFQNAGSTAAALNKTAYALQDGTYLIDNTHGSDLTVTASGSFTAKVNGASADVTHEGSDYTLTVPSSGTNLYVTLDLLDASMVTFNLSYPAGSEQYPYEVDLSTEESFTTDVAAGTTAYFKFVAAGNVIVACDYCTLSLNGSGKNRNEAFAVEAGDVLAVSANSVDSVVISVAPETEGMFTAEQVGTYVYTGFPKMTLILDNNVNECYFTLMSTTYGVEDIQLEGDTYTITCSDGRKATFKFNTDGTITCTDKGFNMSGTLTKQA